MALPKLLLRVFLLSFFVLIVQKLPTSTAQNTINTPCTASMISSFTPCMSFLTNSTASGGSPTTACCGSLKSLMNGGLDCLCLLVTAGIPFQLPVNRALAISLPRACSMPGLPVQCKASAAPLPAPGPAALGPTPSTRDTPSGSPTASDVPQPLSPPFTPPSDGTTPALTPPSDGTTPALTPPTATPEIPATNSGSREGLFPSTATKPYLSLSAFHLLSAAVLIVFKY